VAPDLGLLEDASAKYRLECLHL